MEALILTHSKMKKYLLLLFLSLFLSSCASAGHQALVRYLDDGVDVVTFDEVVKRWGQPNSIAKKDTSYSAIWSEEEYLNLNLHWHSFMAPTVFGESKTLLFDSETNILLEYEVKYW